MITAKNLSKSFGNIRAVDNVNFFINKGEVVALLGPNGAGKSTLMRLLTGFLTPDCGETVICGHNVAEERVEAARKIGYVPENAPLYQEMTVFDFLSFTATLRGLSRTDFRNNLAEVVSRLELDRVLGQRIETLSKGFRRRTAVAAAMLHKPKVLIFDEPTEGLDPNQKEEMRAFIKEYGARNLVLVSTHIMEEVDAVASRVILLNRGKLVRDTSPEELEKISPRGGIAEAFRQLTGGI